MRCGIYVRVSTDEQKENGYSIDSQLRMIKDYCERNNYVIVSTYNDAGYSGKNLMRPEMQRLLKDIKSRKIDKLVAIKVDRITRNNYDGFWLLNYCEEHDVKIELILEPYDVSTANGEMIFGMNLVFGQRERKEIGARTKRAMEEMVLEHVHPNKPPYGYIRNKETGHLEIEPIEAQVVKEIFDLYKKGVSIRNIVNIMKESNAYLKSGKWAVARIHNILSNSIYIGTFEYRKYSGKPQDILIVENYCKPIIDKNVWELTRANLEKNKHPNYGEHIHLFTNLVKCPECGNILSSTISYKKDKNNNRIEYYHITCKNPNCKNKGLHYNSDQLENKLSRILNELTRYMFDNKSEIIISNTSKSKEINDIDKALIKLKNQEKKLVDLYISSNLNVDAINNKNDMIKKEILKLEEKKKQIDPDNSSKEYTLELLKKLDCKVENNQIVFSDKTCFAGAWDILNRKAKKEILNRTIKNIEITRDKKYNIEIKNIKFTDEFISKNPREYIEYLNDILSDNNIGIKYEEMIDEERLNELSKKYHAISYLKLKNGEFTDKEINYYKTLIQEHFYYDGIIECPYYDGTAITDRILLIPKARVVSLNK